MYTNFLLSFWYIFHSFSFIVFFFSSNFMIRKFKYLDVVDVDTHFVCTTKISTRIQNTVHTSYTKKGQ